MAGRTFAPDTSFCRRAMAAFTLCSLRPLMMISAPLSARPLAIAKPIPAVEAVTSATFPDKSIFMFLPSGCESPIKRSSDGIGGDQ